MKAISDKLWDVVIVGAGMGGGAAAYGLCRAGYRVLLLELGTSEFSELGAADGLGELTDPEERISTGRWPTKVEMQIDNRTSLNWPIIGCGIGGSTLVYGATLERLAAIDFEPPDEPSTGLPMAWPFSYSEIQPYYKELEQLLEVRGTQDPLDPASDYSLLEPPPLNPSDDSLFSAMSAGGLEPYRLHVGIRYDSGCTECGGYLCARQCKSDAKSRLVLPALNSGNLTILDRATVTRLDAGLSRVNRVVVERGKETFTINARAVILAAGALNSPGILLNSVSEDWPDGIGNQHDMVGRNLMFHAYDLFAVWPTRRNLSTAGPSRTLASRKFYRHEGKRLGYIHSTGLMAGQSEINHFLHQRLASGPLRRMPFLRTALRFPAWVASKMFKEATILSTIVEDLPNPDNRVLVSSTSPSGIAIKYDIPRELIHRTRLLRKLIRQHLPKQRMLTINRDVMLNFGHPCGTCRSGKDPLTSVVDRDCRIHQIENLFIADGSVMPTSGGVNPSLTIGATALRVAGRVANLLEQGAL